MEGPISGGDRVEEPGLGRAVGCTPMDMLLLGRWVESGKERRRHQPGVCFQPSQGLLRIAVLHPSLSFSSHAFPYSQPGKIQSELIKAADCLEMKSEG